MKVEITRIREGVVSLRARDEETNANVEFNTTMTTIEYNTLNRMLERAAMELGRVRMTQLLKQLMMVLLFVLPVSPLLAQQVTLSWTAPTLNVDGTPVTGPLTYSITGGRQGQTPTSLVSGLTALSWTHQLTSAWNQTWCYQVRAVATYGESAWSSPPACRTFGSAPPAAPSPPLLTVIGVGRVADWAPVFRISAATGARGTSVLGLVQVGTACSGPLAFRYRDRNWHRVEPAAVDWWGTPDLSAQVAAPCRAT